jgi:hypothetical protein
MIGLVTSCGDEKKKDAKEAYKFNILVRNYNIKAASNRSMQIYVGTVTGLSSCKYHGNTYKKKHGLDDDWQVICCWYTKSFKCQIEYDVDGKSLK